MLVALVSSPSK